MKPNKFATNPYTRLGLLYDAFYNCLVLSLKFPLLRKLIYFINLDIFSIFVEFISGMVLKYSKFPLLHISLKCINTAYSLRSLVLI